MRGIVLSDNYTLPVTDENQNRNVIVVGTSGCGKTMSVIEPTIIGNQMDYSMVIVDPKGALYRKYSDEMIKRGFGVATIDLANLMKSSVGFNPLSTIKNDHDIFALANMVVYAEKTLYESAKVDPYWNQQAAIFLAIMIDYVRIMKRYEKKKPTLNDVTNLFISLRTDDCETDLDRYIERIPSDSLAYKQYMQFKRILRAEKTVSCIFSTLGGIISPWSSDGMMKLFSKVDFDITMLAREPGIFFLRIPDFDATFYPVATFMVNYWIDQLFKYADKQVGGKCNVPVQFILDDYSSNITIDNLPRYISTCRARNISMMIMIQSLSQLKVMHEENAKTIINNCSHGVFFSTLDIDTAEDLSKRLNIPLNEALSIPDDKVIICRRGKEVMVQKRFDYHRLEENKDIPVKCINNAKRREEDRD